MQDTVVVDELISEDDAATENDNNEFLNDEVTKTDNEEVTLQSLLQEKQRLQGEADFAVTQLLKKNKFGRGDIARAFRKVSAYLAFVDSFQELILSDLQIVDGRFRGIEENLFKVSQQQSILLTALKSNNIVTDEQMVSAWTDVVKPTLETKIAEMNQKVTEQVAMPVTTAAETPVTE